jgi:hypothetical protein
MADIASAEIKFEIDAPYLALGVRLEYERGPPPILEVAEAVGREDWGRLLGLAASLYAHELFCGRNAQEQPLGRFAWSLDCREHSRDARKADQA